MMHFCMIIAEAMELMASYPPHFSHIGATPYSIRLSICFSFCLTYFGPVLGSSTTCKWIPLKVHPHVLLNPYDSSDSLTYYDFTSCYHT